MQGKAVLEAHRCQHPSGFRQQQNIRCRGTTTAWTTAAQGSWILALKILLSTMNAYCYTFSFGNPEVMISIVDWVKAACQYPVDQPEPGGQGTRYFYIPQRKSFLSVYSPSDVKNIQHKKGKNKLRSDPLEGAACTTSHGRSSVQAAAGIVRHAALSPPFVGCKAKQSSLQSLLKTHSCCLSSWVSCRRISHPHRESLQTQSLVWLLHHIPGGREGATPLFLHIGLPE